MRPPSATHSVVPPGWSDGHPAAPYASQAVTENPPRALLAPSGAPLVPPPTPFGFDLRSRAQRDADMRAWRAQMGLRS